VYGQALTKKGLADGIDEQSKHGGREGFGARDSSRGQFNQRRGAPIQRIAGDPRAGWRSGDGRRDGGRDFRHDRVQTTFIFVNATPFYYSDSYASAPTVDQVTDNYYQPGYQWGVALSQYTVTWDQLITYLQDYILNASPTAQDAFRSGFIDGFGGSGPATFDHAMQVASSQ
jgi:hypothetical protein